MTLSMPVFAEDIDAIIQRIRSGTRSFVTNVFGSASRHRRLQVVDCGEHFVLLKQNEESCSRLFFAARQEEMRSALAGIRHRGLEPLVVDLVGQPPAIQNLAEEFSVAGFRPYLRLIRLSRPGGVSANGTSGSPPCEPAQHTDISPIIHFLRHNFDAYTDQLPDYDEIREAVDAHGIRVLRHEGALDGFLWHKKTGLTALVRYWCSNPDARGRGVGGRLMHDYFERTRECTRHLLWARENNIPALTRYRHYGYSPDGLEDQLMLLDR
jgi:GNAT superfamily N-acetyltransferase